MHTHAGCFMASSKIFLSLDKNNDSNEQDILRDNIDCVAQKGAN